MNVQCVFVWKAKALLDRSRSPAADCMSWLPPASASHPAGLGGHIQRLLSSIKSMRHAIAVTDSTVGGGEFNYWHQQHVNQSHWRSRPAERLTSPALWPRPPKGLRHVVSYVARHNVASVTDSADGRSGWTKNSVEYNSPMFQKYRLL